ncbi:hypothetical protein KLEB273_gp061 [Bacillus phage vB_BauM_KLEB27-3]|nr:hypothetical protein KLEB273_gp061 [Bacillus phage vB_BauM_KLEB27-3]
MNNKMPIEQNKLELMIAIAFSLLILFLSSTEVGYVTISKYRELDLAIIPAVFAALIGGYRVGIPVAIAWALIGYNNEASGLQIYTLHGVLITKVGYVVAATWSYKWFRKKFVGSPYNVYRAVLTAVFSKWIISNLMVSYIIRNWDKYQAFVNNSVRESIIEAGLCVLMMALTIKHFRQIHILNGIKRKEKNKKEEHTERG